MKKITVLILSIMLIFPFISTFTTYAAESLDYTEEITRELDDIFSDFGVGFEADDIENLSFAALYERFKDELFQRLNGPISLLSSIFLVIVFAAVTKSVAESADEMYDTVCVIASTAVLLPRLTSVYEGLLTTIQTTGSFVFVFVPVLSAVSVACGGFTTAGVCHMALLGASEVIVRLSESYLLPVLGIMASMGAIGSIFPSISLDSMVNLLKKTITWAISVTMTLFSGYVTLKCTITGRADGAAAKTAKMLVSGFVPIVGGAVSDAYSTVKGSFEVIGGTVGAAGIIAIAAILLPTLLELLVYRFVMWAGSAAADVFSADFVSKLLKSIDSGLAVAQCIIICYSVIFVLCTAILIKTFGG